MSVPILLKTDISFSGKYCENRICLLCRTLTHIQYLIMSCFNFHGSGGGVQTGCVRESFAISVCMCLTCSVTP